MYINGIVLRSSVIDASTVSFSPGDDRSYIFYLPTYAATAWYYKLLKNRPDDVGAFISSAREFAATEYADALMKGTKLTDAERTAIAGKLAGFTGLSEDYLLTENFEFDPSFTAVVGAFTAAFNGYVREELKFGQDKTYKVLPSGPSEAWDWKHNAGQGGGFPSAPNVGNDLVREMIDNTHLRVEVENGYFDMATPFFATEYTMDHLLLPGNVRDRIHLQYYTSGHMIYLHDEDRAKLKNNIGAFIESATKQ
jgi:carboxypeptidase C (cathepsin A)